MTNLTKLQVDLIMSYLEETTDLQKEILESLGRSKINSKDVNRIEDKIDEISNNIEYIVDLLR